MLRRIRTSLVIALLGLSIVIILASLLVGTESVSLKQAWAEWQSGLSLKESRMLSILLLQRLPRTLAALIAGAGLAVGGCAFQALLRNPLATPYTLGVASAGALGAWTASIVIPSSGLWLGLFGPGQVLAFIFAAADVLIVYYLAAGRRRMSPSVLLLAGVTMGMVSNSGILLLRYLAQPERLVAMERWLMGGVDVLGFGPVWTLLAGVAPCTLVLLFQAAKFDQIGFGPELAAGRGINVARLQLITFLFGSLMTAIIVSVVGPIGFVGLIIPHAVRSVTGSRHRVLMPISLLVGGAFLCACDIIARKIIHGEFPIGIITTLLGGPFFLYLLLRRSFTDWEV